MRPSSSNEQKGGGGRREIERSNGRRSNRGGRGAIQLGLLPEGIYIIPVSLSVRPFITKLPFNKIEFISHKWLALMQSSWWKEQSSIQNSIEILLFFPFAHIKAGFPLGLFRVIKNLCPDKGVINSRTEIH